MHTDDFSHRITLSFFSFMKHHFSHMLLRKLNVATALSLVVLTTGVTTTSLFAAATSNFAQTINPGTLSVDIVDATYVAVGSPSVLMAATPFSFACQTTSGSFGTATQQIYVKNPDASDSGWTIALAAATPTAFWDGAAADYDFNDPTAAGCGDGADVDTLKGQMTVDASVGTLATGACLSCTTTSVTKGSSASYNQGTVDSITLLTGAAASSDIGDWKLTGVAVTQKIPAEQPAASDYFINMTLSVTAI